MNPFRWVLRAKAKVGRLELQLSGVEQAVVSVESRLARLEQQAAVVSVESRLARLEQLVGFGDGGESERAETQIGKILDARLTHLEARLLTYLEGPYFARVAEPNSNGAAPGGQDRG